MLLADYAAGLAAIIYILSGSVKWILGKRREAIESLEAVVDILIHLLALQVIFWIADLIASYIQIPLSFNATGTVSEKISYSSSVFWEASQKAISTIMYVQTERALLASAPLTSPLSSVLGAATGWAISELSILAIFYMHLSYAAKFFSVLAPYLALIGSILLPVPKIRRVGASLLAIYLATSISFILSAQIVSRDLEKIPEISPLNPVDWISVSSKVSDITIKLGESATLIALAFSISIVAGYGLAGVFDSIYVSVVRI
ncbi:MAG: hypothetical protein ACP5II_04675 [Infirmifilum sp.]|jgi:hypothetical protein|nr:hypothetical protein [Infirmifilum uzonense]